MRYQTLERRRLPEPRRLRRVGGDHRTKVRWFLLEQCPPTLRPHLMQHAIVRGRLQLPAGDGNSTCVEVAHEQPMHGEIDDLGATVTG